MHRTVVCGLSEHELSAVLDERPAVRAALDESTASSYAARLPTPPER